MTKDMGGPATGMTLWDYFAAHALNGSLASCSQGGYEFTGTEKEAKFVADMADAMIAERKKRMEAQSGD